MANLSFNKGCTVRPREIVAQEKKKDGRLKRSDKNSEGGKIKKKIANNKGITGEACQGVKMFVIL